jgi:exosortase E/protease (VPEID-CTERM system)
VWIANVLRIAALVLIGAHVSPAVAVGGFHSFSGLLLFCTVALAAAAIAYGSPYFSTAAAIPADDGTDHSHHARAASPAPWIVPLMVMIATSLITGLFSTAGFDPLYVLRVVTTVVALAAFRRAYPPLWPRSFPAAAAALGVGALVCLIWVGLTSHSAHTLITPPYPPHTPAGLRWIFWRAVGSVFVAPVAEELAFRGYLARRTMAADFASIPLDRLSWRAIALAALVSGALHAHFIAGCVAGLAYGWTARRRGRLSDAIFAHAGTNALLVAYVVSRGAWWLLG